jgi:hypothetical protein
MPLPKTSNVGTIIRKLNKEGSRPRKQKIAIALSQARKHGARIPEAKEAVRKATI